MNRFGLPLVPSGLALWTLNFSDRFPRALRRPGRRRPLLARRVARRSCCSAVRVPHGVACVRVLDLRRRRSAADVRVRAHVPAVRLVARARARRARAVARPASPVTPLLGGRRRRRPLAFAGAFWGAYIVVAIGVGRTKRTQFNWVVTGRAAAVNVGLNLVLIPRYGIHGARGVRGRRLRAHVRRHGVVGAARVPGALPVAPRRHRRRRRRRPHRRRARDRPARGRDPTRAGLPARAARARLLPPRGTRSHRRGFSRPSRTPRMANLPVHVAAVLGAAGAVLVLVSERRAALTAGFAALAAAECCFAIAAPTTQFAASSGLRSRHGARRARGRRRAGALFVRQPALVMPVALAAAPFRLPLDFDPTHRFFVAVAGNGELGRLLPLYTVLAGAVLRCSCAACASPRSPGSRPSWRCRRPRFSATRRCRHCGRATSTRRATGSRSSCCRSRRSSRSLRERRSRRGCRARWPVRPSGSACCSRPSVCGRREGALLLLAEPRGVEHVHAVLPGHFAVPRPEPLRTPHRPRDLDRARRALGPTRERAARRGRDHVHVGGPLLLVLAVEHGVALRRRARAARGRGLAGHAPRSR